MPYQVPSPEESKSVSLESRFGVEKDSVNTENTSESVVENTPESVAEEGIVERDAAYRNALTNIQDDDTDEDVMQDASAVHQQMDRESQITQLIDLAMEKGVVHAVKVAQKTDDYYVLDQLHDRLLTDELHEALESRGMISQQ